MFKKLNEKISQWIDDYIESRHPGERFCWYCEQWLPEEDVAESIELCMTCQSARLLEKED